MSTLLLVDEIAQHIRIVDGANALDPQKLGDFVAGFLIDCGLIVTQDAAIAVTDFVASTNPDKRMGAGQLAELIVAEFGLDEEG